MEFGLWSSTKTGEKSRQYSLSNLNLRVRAGFDLGISRELYLKKQGHASRNYTHSLVVHYLEAGKRTLSYFPAAKIFQLTPLTFQRGS
ncbi:hypothetical protein KQX54_019694 [Cotesia glomerata]|uniref:Uncharacterized protein n=1 Tax=Cotesia glomerata TaxID=32391 RepID=A0AAV7HZI1_COTGL|nr:hypothetical protein KQX54_019694 [Cotesia glomerata]